MIPPSKPYPKLAPNAPARLPPTPPTRSYDFLIAVAEPVSRPELIHEYALTPHSLYAAVSIGLDTVTILAVLERLAKAALPPEVRAFVREATANYGKVKLVLARNRFWVESAHPAVLRRLLKDEVVRTARVMPPAGEGGGGLGGAAALGGAGGAADAADAAGGAAVGGGFAVSRALQDRAVAALAATRDLDVAAAAAAAVAATAAAAAAAEAGAVEGGAEAMDVDGEEEDEEGGGDAAGAFAATAAAALDPDRELHSFEIDAAQVRVFFRVWRARAFLAILNSFAA